MNEAVVSQFEPHFPNFARFLASNRYPGIDDFLLLDEVSPPASVEEIEAGERSLGVPLPVSFRQFLLIASSVNLADYLNIGLSQTFFHEFEPWEELSEKSKRQIMLRGGLWPPPSHGMLCFGDCWLEGNGDQALFDVSKGLIDGEYPVFYYNHDDPSVRKLADSFHEFIENVIAERR